jgi:hypothetical protein
MMTGTGYKAKHADSAPRHQAHSVSKSGYLHALKIESGAPVTLSSFLSKTIEHRRTEVAQPQSSKELFKCSIKEARCIILPLSCMITECRSMLSTHCIVQYYFIEYYTLRRTGASLDTSKLIITYHTEPIFHDGRECPRTMDG